MSPDFAVGAPFHQTGMVYIWMGSKKGISRDPSQVMYDILWSFKNFIQSTLLKTCVNDSLCRPLWVGRLVKNSRPSATPSAEGWT